MNSRGLFVIYCYILCHGGLLPRTDQIRHSRDVCSTASEGEATELPPILNRGQHAVVIVGNVRGTARMIGVGDREHHDASANGDGTAATAHIIERKIAFIPRDKDDRIAVPCAR